MVCCYVQESLCKETAGPCILPISCIMQSGVPWTTNIFLGRRGCDKGLGLHAMGSRLMVS